MKVRDVIKIVEADGWYHIETKGDHRQYRHPVKKGRVTIPGHLTTEMHPKTCKTILVQQAQIDIQQIRRKR